jgi:hypothetical protein
MTRPESQINKGENCELWMLTLAATPYATDVINHEMKPAIWTWGKPNQQQF